MASHNHPDYLNYAESILNYIISSYKYFFYISSTIDEQKTKTSLSSLKFITKLLSVPLSSYNLLFLSSIDFIYIFNFHHNITSLTLNYFEASSQIWHKIKYNLNIHTLKVQVTIVQLSVHSVIERKTFLLFYSSSLSISLSSIFTTELFCWCKIIYIYVTGEICRLFENFCTYKILTIFFKIIIKSSLKEYEFEIVSLLGI